MEKNDIPRKLRHTFSPAEMQSIVGGALGNDLRTTHLADCLRPQLEDNQSVLSIIIRRNRLSVDARALLQKLEALEPQELIVLQRTVENAVASLEDEPDGVFGVRGVPCINVLRAAGLVVPSGTAAWGFFIVVLDGWAHVEEIVLHHRPIGRILPTLSVKEHAERLVEILRTLMKNSLVASQQALFRECYALAVASGFRLARVHANGADVSVVEIPIRDLQSDMRDGGLGNLVIEGVNAPMAMG
ncbi:hypothetical protein [Aureimonas leprariae]|uniref:Uncharacterized protein n=1 Tax=Plantimonas leprariae TaxID=2615207 RepID=A0A7V7PMJ2_9HYPH|nr:hypothetical protein [Aureimonas leprariae]KAB0678446.1 hypothetical protein F6X38_15530 [Aureimonas leprariae]